MARQGRGLSLLSVQNALSPAERTECPPISIAKTRVLSEFTKATTGKSRLMASVLLRSMMQWKHKLPPGMIYVEPSATDEQLIALERIMQSFNPLQPSIISNVERVPISFIRTGRNGVYEVKIPKILEIRIRRRLDRDGRPLFATAALDQFSNTIDYAQNLTYKLWDRDGTLKWDYSGRQANYRSIDLDSQAYIRQAMLIQFADAGWSLQQKAIGVNQVSEPAVSP